MSDINAYCLAAYLLILGRTKTRDAILVCLCFFVSVWYTDFGYLYHAQPAWMNHLIISLLILPAAFFACKPVSLALIGYISYHWLIAGDYIFFEHSHTFLSLSFFIVSPFLNIVIMVALIYARFYYNHHPYCGMGRGWLSNNLADFISKKKMGRR